MKRLFVFFLVVLMAVAGMVVPVSAADLPPLPDFDNNADGYTCVGWVLTSSSPDSYVYNCIYVPSGLAVSDYPYFVYNTYSDSLQTRSETGNYKVRTIWYDCWDGVWEWNYSGLKTPVSGSKFGNADEFLTANVNIRNQYSDDLWFEIGGGKSGLVSAVPVESLTGALGEVLGVLVVALPVIAGLFGIRKGIAFLLSRVRGV